MLVLYSGALLSKMNRELAVTLVVILGLPYGLQQELQSTEWSGEQECPTWFVPQGNQTGDCWCGVETLLSLVVVKCDEHSKQSMIYSGFCMTYNGSTNKTVLGRCPYNSHKTDYQEFYVKLPQNVSNLNDFMCGGLNRTGLLCSHCTEGLGVPMFSYLSHCLPCLGSVSGWLLYIFLAVFPTTVFFFIIIIFQLRVTSASMNAFIFSCQFISVVINAEPYVILNISTSLRFVTIAISTLYGFWNLDFFRYVIPSFCASDQLTPIQVVALEYVVAFYPLLLITTTYICVELHAKGCRIIVHLWRPISRCLAFVSRGRGLKFSLVHAFASFLLLCYSKILFVSFQLLTDFNLYKASGIMVGPPVLYYDASVEFLGTTHFPFALLAIFVLFIFIVLPALVLLLYPTKVFQRSLGLFRVRWHALHAFADTFNGCYKNGTEGTRDYRYFAGLYLILRVILLSIVLHVDIFAPYIFGLVILSCALVSLLFALLRPYKTDWINVWDSVVFACIAFALSWIAYDEWVVRLPLDVAAVIDIVPLIYIFVYVLYRNSHVFRKCRVFLNHYRTHPQSETDRLLNPEEYRQLQPNSDCPENEHSRFGTPCPRDHTYPDCGNSLQGNSSLQ